MEDADDAAIYRDPRYLRGAIRDVLNVYYPAAIDTRHGGYVAQLDERGGEVYDGASKHLVATARGVHNFSLGWRLDGPPWCRTAAEHGLQFLDVGHYDAENGGYDWLLSRRETEDATRYCYGHAFVLLAHARAVEAGLASAERVHETADLLEERFWEPDRGLFAAEASPDWSSTDPYRGQNANMHACEAHIAGYEATGDESYLDRAATVADALARGRARAADGPIGAGTADSPGLVWEHYAEDWEPDLEYNRDQPRHTFRPWGYQPGHQVEWAKLLCLLDRHDDGDRDWYADRAAALFDAAVDLGWDDEDGGFYYTLDLDGDPVVDDKYGWPVAEAIGAAALLSQHDAEYWEWYDHLWAYAEEHFINPRLGNWYARLTREHDRDGPNRGVAVEPGYHPIANAAIALEVVEEDRA